MANKRQDTGEKKKERKLKLYIRRFIKLMIKLGILAGVFILIFKYVFGIHYLRGNYMFPALKDGDLILTYKLEEPVKNDVVLYDMNGEERLGRIVGYEGDTIAFSVDGELMVNGCVASEEIFYPTTERVALHQNVTVRQMITEVLMLNHLLRLQMLQVKPLKKQKLLPRAVLHQKIQKIKMMLCTPYQKEPSTF